MPSRKPKRLTAEDVKKIPRRGQNSIRYHLYRIRSHYGEGVDLKAGNPDYDLTMQLKEYYQDQPGFNGWQNFAMNWDVGSFNVPANEKDRADEPRSMIVPRSITEQQSWQHTLMRVALPLELAKDASDH